ncbi:MAG: MarR family winged helix-turn-helix transcriptional regulator [Bacteroidota bacterium]
MDLHNLERTDPRICISSKVRRLNRLVANIFRKYILPFDITSSQLSILFILSKNEQGFSQKELSQFSVLEKSSLHRNLKRMIERELVSRAEFPIIKITEKGKQLTNDIIPEWEKAMAEVRGIMGEEGESALDIVLNKFT